jgi:catechol 2,3-dioxygenase-like lactoylglutathione lyase family enzyme
LKFLRTTLLTKNPALLRDFYAEKLGLNVVLDTDQQVMLNVGESQLTFDKARDGWRGFYHFAFNIPRNQFAEAKAWSTELITLIKTPEGADTVHHDKWQADSLYFYDPAGNIVELIARHTLKNDVDGPFGPKCLLNVSEIGIVTNHVKDTVDSFINGLHTRIFDGAGSPNFCAVGDENALLIIVKAGRLWLPDLAKSADYFPVQALVQNNDGHSFQLDISPALFDKPK